MMAGTVSLLLFSLLAATPPNSSEPEALSQMRSSPADGALWVFLDPETGEIDHQVDPGQAAIRARGSGSIRRRRSADALRRFFLPGGGEGVYLDGWADHAMSARRGDDGELELVCLQGDSHADVEPGQRERDRASAEPGELR